MKRSILSICILLTSVSLVFANIYKKYDVRSGLSGNCVRSILQDSIGYMWFATQDGLNRFNGIEFTNYGHSSENGGNSYMNIVTICRHQDNNQIWVASTEKLYLFDSREEKFSVFDTQTEDGVTVNSVFGMAYDNDGQLWIGTANGLFVYNEKKGTLRQYLHSLSDPHSLPDNHVWVIYNDSFGTIWIGTRNGLAKYNQRTDNFTGYISEDTSFGRPACNEIISLMESSQGVLWAGTWYGGLTRFNKETGQFRYYFGEGDTLTIPRIRTLFQRTANSFYLGSDDGLYTFNTTTGECLPTDDGQNKESIYACYQDREGGIWIGTYFSGVSYLSPKHKDIEWYYPNGTENSLSGNVISQFCEDPNGNIWIATEDGGLNLFDPRTKKFKNHLLRSSNPNIGYHNIHALLYNEGKLWIGSFSRGLYILDIQTGKMKNYRHNRANASHEHEVQPGMVYISNPTEVGTLYNKEELTDIAAACYDLGLYLFVDGARMAYGLTSPANDLSLQDYAALCDVFYLGGTKCGALFGEAVVITNDDLKPDFRYCLKQHGGMLAKGRLLGEQFLALLDGEDGSGSSLYFTMAKKADEQALRIRAAFEAKGCKVLHDSPTNQQFFVLPDEWYDKLAETYAMTHMGKPDKHHTAVRVCTSWATKDEAVEQLIADVNGL